LSRGSARRLARIAAFLSLAVFFAREAVFGGRTFFLRDLHMQWFGQVESLVRAVASGSWPLWDPYVSFGQPLLANANVQVLYPLTWLNFLMRPTTYYTVYFVFHLVLAGAGASALARRLGCSDAGALVAGAAWLACGPFLSLGSLWNHFAGAAWMAWVLLGVDHALSGSRRGVAVWALALAATLLAGSPDLALLGLVPVAGLLAARLEWRRPFGEANRRTLFGAALAVCLGIGIAAAQILPSLEVADRSTRWSMGLASRTYWSAHPAGLLQAFVPLTWDALPWSTSVRAALFESREPYLPSLYLGLPVLALAACGLLTSTVRHRSALGIAALVCGLLALAGHTPVYSAAVSLFPLLRAVRFPVKALVPAALAVALLAGSGFDSWRGRALRPRAALGLGLGLAAVGVAGLALLLACRRWPQGLAALVLAPGMGPGALAPAARAGLELALLGSLILLLAVLGRRTAGAARATAVVLSALGIVDLARFHADLNPTAPVDFLRFRPEALKALDQADGRRLFVYDYGVQPEASRRHLGREVAYVVPAATGELWRGALGMRVYPVPPVAAAYAVLDSYGRDLLGIQPLPLFQLNAALFASEGSAGFDRLLRIGAVSRMLALHEDGLSGLRLERRLPGPFFEDIRLYDVPDPSPRAFLVGEGRVGDIGTLLDPGLDPARAVVLAEPPARPAPPGFAGEARLVEARADRVRLQCDASTPALLVLVDTYDPGWRARVDGEPAPILRANVAFRAVPVPAGRHEVEMVYRPRSVTLGLLTSGAAILLLAAWSGGIVPASMVGFPRAALPPGENSR
jgi:hypothetical protein